MSRRHADGRAAKPAGIDADNTGLSPIQQRMRQIAHDYRPAGQDDPLTATEISQRTGLSLQYVYNLFSGKAQNPTKDAMQAFCAAFPGLTLNYFADTEVLPEDVRDKVHQETQQVRDDLELVQRLRRANVTDAAARLGELDGESLRLAVELIERLGASSARTSRPPGQ